MLMKIKFNALLAPNIEIDHASHGYLHVTEKILFGMKVVQQNRLI